MAIHDGNPSVPNSRLEDLSSATKAIHADDYLNKDGVADVAPAMHVSTTFRYPDSPEDLVPYEDLDVRSYLMTCCCCGLGDPPILKTEDISSSLQARMKTNSGANEDTLEGASR